MESRAASSMDSTAYSFSAEPVRNPLRYLLALWRSVRDPANTYEVAIVQMGFARSRLGRRFARWEEVINALRRDPRTAERLAARRLFGPIDLAALDACPAGSLGHVFAAHCRARGLNPNLGYIPPTTEVDWILNHAYQTHDLWHVVTGWGNDLVGEFGLGGFYVAQLHAPSFFAFLLSLVFLNTVFFARGTFAERMEALVAGYDAGKRAEPLFGADWVELWGVPIGEVRARFKIDGSRIVGDGIRAAA